MLEFIAKKLMSKRSTISMQSKSELEEIKSITKQFQDHAEIMAAVFSASQRGDENVYISDMDTHQILWANDNLVKMLGPMVGKKCYEVLQGFDAPCDFCTNNKIRDGGSYLWTYHNTMLGRDYFIKNTGIWLGNRIVRYEIAYDITGLYLLKMERRHAPRLP